MAPTALCRLMDEIRVEAGIRLDQRRHAERKFSLELLWHLYGGHDDGAIVRQGWDSDSIGCVHDLFCNTSDSEWVEQFGRCDRTGDS